MLIRQSEQFRIHHKVEGDSGSLYVRAYLYDKSGTLLDTENLAHVADGSYEAAYTYSGSERNLILKFKVFTDSGYTTEDTSVFNVPEDVYVDNSSTLTAAQVNAECDTAISDAALATSADMKRALGLMQENMAIDNPTFDSNNNLLTARMRIYEVAASVGTDSDVLATYNMTATFSGAGKVTTYKMVKA